MTQIDIYLQKRCPQCIAEWEKKSAYRVAGMIPFKENVIKRHREKCSQNS